MGLEFSLLTHFRERANLRFQCLVVLAFDLEFGLELLHQQVQVRNFNAELLNVRSCWSWPMLRTRRVLRVVLRLLHGLPWNESFRQGSWPRRFL